MVACSPIWLAVVQSPKHVQLFAIPWTAAHQAFLSLTISWSLPKFMSIVLMVLSSHLILWLPLLLLPSIFPRIRDFSNESAVYIRWPKYWSFSFSISPSNDFPLRLAGLISLLFKGLSGVFSSTTVQRHQFLGALYGSVLTTTCDHWEHHSLDYTDLCWQSNVSAFQHTV